MRRFWFFSLVAGCFLAGCHRDRSGVQPAHHPHYVLGAAWRGTNGWFYPREQFAYRETGIATRERSPASGVVADGEGWSAAGMSAAHQTLQLPAIVRVRNLLNGRVVRVRVNDRGPAEASRIIALSPRAADLLGMAVDTPVEVVEDEQASRALAEALGKTSTLEMKSAPVGEVRAESLSDGSRQVFGNVSADASSSSDMLRPLSASAQQGSSGPDGLYILLGMFSGRQAAVQVAARCGGSVMHIQGNGSLEWQARSGPYGNVSQADMALDRTASCGIDGARIVVE